MAGSSEANSAAVENREGILITDEGDDRVFAAIQRDMFQLHGEFVFVTTSKRLESVGVRCEGVRAGTGLTAAGDVIAGRPRTLLEAVSSGLRAGREA